VGDRVGRASLLEALAFEAPRHVDRRAGAVAGGGRGLLLSRPWRRDRLAHARARSIDARRRPARRRLGGAGRRPFSTWFGNSWGDAPADFTESRARVRSLMHDLLGDRATAAWVVVAGFSQGAAMSADVAVEEPTVDAMASLSPCFMMLRGDLPKRTDLHVLLAHGTRDGTCPVGESRSLAPVLQAAHVPVRYIEFDGGHAIPPEVVRALVALASPPP
jgi:predicted esterase